MRSHHILPGTRDLKPFKQGDMSMLCGLYTERRLILFDSAGLKWIQANNLGLGEGSRRTHWILPDQTMAIEDEW